MSNVLHFPKMPRVLRPRGRKTALGATNDHRFREATKARLRAVLSAVLNILDSLDGKPRRS